MPSTPSASSPSMPSRRPTRAIRARRWHSRPVGYLLCTRLPAPRPKDPPIGPTATASCSPPGTARCCCTACCTSSGYDLTIDDLQPFRQWGSRTPGHPERDKPHAGRRDHHRAARAGLRQRRRHGHRRALAGGALQPPGPEVQDHRTFVIGSDGDLKEGIASEAASLAGHLKLGMLYLFYDNNHIPLDGPTDVESYTEDVVKRFDAYGWHSQTVDAPTTSTATRRRRRRGRRRGRSDPSLISCARSSASRSPNKQDTPKAHGSPLGEDEVRADQGALGLGPTRSSSSRRRVRALTRRSSAARRCRPHGRSASTPGRPRTPSWPPSGTRLVHAGRRPMPGWRTRCPR